ncbi:MAG: metallo-beta-lactamase family protein [Spirosomataceae bacterium]
MGYCSPNSLGYALKTGRDKVKIFGKEYDVKVSVEVMDSFSAHADYAEMIDYLKCQNTDKVKQLFLVHSEIETQTAFAERLKEVGFQNISIPAQGEGFDL